MFTDSEEIIYLASLAVALFRAGRGAQAESTSLLESEILNSNPSTTKKNCSLQTSGKKNCVRVLCI
jgi:hypothetical protein